MAVTHPTRKALLEGIRRRPGARATWLQRAIAKNRGTTNYHLHILTRVGAVRVVVHENGPRYFPAESRLAESPLLSVLLRGRSLEVIEAILREPGISQKDLTKKLPISRKVFREHADKLCGSGLVQERRVKRLMRYFPTQRLYEVGREFKISPPEFGQNQGSRP